MAKTWESAWHNRQQLNTKSGQKLTYTIEAREEPGRKAILQTLKNNKDQQSRARFAQEISTLALLKAAKAVVPEVFEHNSDELPDKNAVMYLVEEYIPGETLAAVLSRGPLPIEKSVEVCRKLASTLQVAFTEGILHRDIKPDNIIVRNLDQNDVVIIDYGLSYHSGAETDTVTRADETFRNKYLDLPETNSPGGDMRDKRSDITALCAIFYSCLTGCQRIGHLQDSTGKLPHLRPGQAIADKLADSGKVLALEMFFNRGFTPQVDLRFQTLDEFLSHLGLAITGNTGDPEDPIEFAARASDRLRSSNSKTIAQGFQAPCQAIISSVQAYAQKNINKLGEFAIAFGGSLADARLPSTCTPIPHVEMGFQLTARGHDVARHALYRFGAEGNQCAVFRLNTGRDGQGKPVTKSEWQRVCLFEWSAKPESATTAVMTDFKRWLGNAMAEIERTLA